MKNIAKRFDRHAEMSAATRGEIMRVIQDVSDIESDIDLDLQTLENYLFGLYDGYYYESDLKNAVNKLNEYAFNTIADILNSIIVEVEKYKLT